MKTFDETVREVILFVDNDADTRNELYEVFREWGQQSHLMMAGAQLKAFSDWYRRTTTILDDAAYEDDIELGLHPATDVAVEVMRHRLQEAGFTYDDLLEHLPKYHWAFEKLCPTKPETKTKPKEQIVEAGSKDYRVVRPYEDVFNDVLTHILSSFKLFDRLDNACRTWKSVAGLENNDLTKHDALSSLLDSLEALVNKVSLEVPIHLVAPKGLALDLFRCWLGKVPISVIDEYLPKSDHWAAEAIRQRLTTPRSTEAETKPETQTEKDIDMTTIDKTTPVQNITYIFGVPADQVTDEQLWGHIGNLESQISQLQGIENKPKSLLARIEKLNANIKELVALADSKAA